MTSHPPKKNPHLHVKNEHSPETKCSKQESQNQPLPPPSNPPQYSSIVAQSIQALTNLLTSVNKDTLIIVIFSAMLFGGGYLLYLQVKALEANTIAVERNTSVNNEMKVFIQEVVREMHEHKNDH
jgi:hypothetical protein